MRKTFLATGAIAAILAAGIVQAQDNLMVAICKNGTQQYFGVPAAECAAAADELGCEARIINVEPDRNLAIFVMPDAIASGAGGSDFGILSTKAQTRAT